MVAKPLLYLIGIMGMSLVFLPLAPSLIILISTLFDPEPWIALWQNNQFIPALIYTLISAFGSTLIALGISLWAVINLYSSPRWIKIQQNIPFLLALPQAAFAIGISFLIAPSGWFSRCLAFLFNWQTPPQWITVQDPYAITLTLTLAIKESWFLIWVLSMLLADKKWIPQQKVAASLGYSQQQINLAIILPPLLPQLTWPLLAVLAYSLSVIDVAQLLGPNVPPTLAVLAWQWIMDPDTIRQQQGHAVSFILLGLLIVSFILMLMIKPMQYKQYYYPTGQRQLNNNATYSLITILMTTIGFLPLALLVLWSLSEQWFFPHVFPQQLGIKSWLNANYTPLITSLLLALSCIIISLPLILIWLEWGPKKYTHWLYFPLIIPALPLAAAQYHVLLLFHLEGTFMGLIWSHLTWVIPYMLLILSAPYQALNYRYMLIAGTLGKNSFKSCLQIKWPLLLAPILSAIAIGFSVSIAQYLPTLFAGAGRFDTLTTEAITLGSGGSRQTLAIQAFLQALLPMSLFLWVTYQANRFKYY